MRPSFSVIAVLAGLLALAACATAEPPLPDLRASVAASSSYKTLLAAIRQGGLIGTLESQGPYTLFAPTDAAFDALPPGIERKLFAPENKDELAQVLRYHLVSGRLTSADLKGKISTPVTLEGGRLQIDGIGPEIEVDDAQIVQPDALASNGVMHGIDRVLLPQ
jgi:uncharacterized surface protein with fasciclin (FAS1) repeats